MTVSPSEIVHSFEHFLRILGDVMVVEELAPLAFVLLWGSVVCTLAFVVWFVLVSVGYAFRSASKNVRAGIECWLPPRDQKECDEETKE